MTNQEKQNAFMEKYRDVKVKFYNYYKYTFYYSAMLDDGSFISVSYGGNSDDIYRHEVIVDRSETVGGLSPYHGVVTRNGETVDEFYNY
jgi:hypothetical protein